MAFFPIFLSIVYVVRNQENKLEKIIQHATEVLAPLVADYELIIVDNSSDDETISLLKRLIGTSGYPNVQIYSLTKEVDSDTAALVGLENALGDFVAVIDPLVDDISFLPKMLDRATTGIDVVFAKNLLKPRQSIPYRISHSAFNLVYKSFNGIDLANEAPQYRLLSKKIVNFILQHSQPALSYRHLPVTGGFARINMEYTASPLQTHPKRISECIDRGMRLLVSTTQAPMRLVTSLSIFGAAANLIYSLYVLAIGFFKSDVAPGWISLSLQQSGMFFLISLVLLVLGEYILNVANLSKDSPTHHITQEFTSARMIRREKLNVEDISSPNGKSSNDSNHLAI